MQALVAVMRKLLHAIFCMFKHYEPYDGSKVYRPREVPTPPKFRCAPHERRRFQGASRH